MQTRMPPKAAKRAAAGRGRKRAARGRRRAAETNVQPLPEESSLKAAAAEEEEEVEFRDGRVDEEKPSVVVAEKEIQVEHEEAVKADEGKMLQENQDASMTKDDNAKEPVHEHKRDERPYLEDNHPESEPEEDDNGKQTVHEYERDEQLDLENNDLGSEPEEGGDVVYDEKEIEQDPHFPSRDSQKEGDEVEEEPEEVEVCEEDEGDVVVEQIEGMPEELEPEKRDEIVEECAKMVDTAEEVDRQVVVKERRKRREFEIFVGGLDKDTTEVDLREVFNKVGDVIEVRLMMNPQTKKNKGFAFLRFATAEQAKQACVQLKNPVVHGKQCGVTPSQDSDTLFLGNICRTWSKEALIEKLKHYGVENIEDLTLVEDTNNMGMNRGFAFIEFSSRSDAMDAFKCLQKRNAAFGVDRPAKVSFADSFIDPGDEIMSQVKTLFVDCLPPAWDEGHVKELLKQYGEIEKVELARNMPSAKRKDFGFVTFFTHDAAVTCARSINNHELGEGYNKANVRARLSRPLQRSKGNIVARGEFRSRHGSVRGVRSPRGSPVLPSIPLHGSRGIGPRLPPPVDRGFKRPANTRDRRPAVAVPRTSKPVAPLPRPYDRRARVPPYSKSGLNREYGHPEGFPPWNRAPADYYSRCPSDRGPYRDHYSPRGSDYPDFPRDGASWSTARSDYIDDSYNQRYEMPPLIYREVLGHEYESLSGSKRLYSAMDDVPPHYAETEVHCTRARLDYGFGSSGSHFPDVYGDRLGRSNQLYGGSRSSLLSQDSHGLYSGRHGTGGDSRGSGSSSDGGGLCSSSFGGDYLSPGSDVGGSSYSSLYPERGLDSNNYMGSGGFGPYY